MYFCVSLSKLNKGMKMKNPKGSRCHEQMGRHSSKGEIFRESQSSKKLFLIIKKGEIVKARSYEDDFLMKKNKWKEGKDKD